MVDLSYVLHDRAHVLAPGLFRSLGPGDRARLKLHVVYNYGPDERLEFKGFEPLGALEMRVLQGIIAMAGKDGLLLEDEDRASEQGRQLMLLLYEPDPVLQAARLKPPSLIVRDSMRRLAREIGVGEGGRNIKLIRESIERLFGVTVKVQKGSFHSSTHLLSAYASDEQSGELYVALNPRLAAAILGKAQHARIDLIEARTLKSDPARLIHQRLSGWIDPGKSGEVTVEKLAAYVWPDEATEATMRFRKTRVRKAVAEIVEAGWRVEEVRKDCWRFIRPKLKPDPAR